tara:strand:+ start:32690 stop:33013 length:324 start_codon:yes stop_codon:yes gene_type:complete
MQTIHATEAAEAATNINREDWISGAAELVLANEVQYDRSGENYREAFISRDSVIEDISCTDEYELLIIKWLDGGECYDCRDELRNMILNESMSLLSVMADDFNIGVR